MAGTWAEQALGNALGLRAGESVVLIADEPLAGAGRALEDAARAMGAGRVSLHLLPFPSPRLSLVSSRLLREVAAADAVLSLLSQFDLTQEQPMMRAAMAAFREAGRGRWGYGAGLDQAVLEQAMAGEAGAVAETARSLFTRLDGSEGVRMTSEAGTDLTLVWSGRPFSLETGMLGEPGAFGNVPGGEVYVAPLEGSAEGRLVVDLSLGDLPLDQPVALTFRRGRVVAVEGGEAARELKRRLGKDPWAWTVGEFGLGANPHMPVRGRTPTDEKALGTAHVALGGNRSFGGDNPAESHYDCVISAPRLRLRRGHFQEPLLPGAYKR